MNKLFLRRSVFVKRFTHEPRSRAKPGRARPESAFGASTITNDTLKWRQPQLSAICGPAHNYATTQRPLFGYEGVLKAEPGEPSHTASSGRRLNLTTRFSGHLSAVFDLDAGAAVQIQPTCRTVGHLSGVPFRLLGDRERPVFRAEDAIER